MAAHNVHESNRRRDKARVKPEKNPKIVPVFNTGIQQMKEATREWLKIVWKGNQRKTDMQRGMEA